MLEDYWNKGENYRDDYERRERRRGSGAMAGELLIYLQGIHNQEATDIARLREGMELLSGSGILDDIIDKALAVVKRRFEDVGERLYGPIIEMKYGSDGGYTWYAVEEILGISGSYRYARCREAILAIGLVFFTEFYEDWIQYLKYEENKKEHFSERRYVAKTRKAIKAFNWIKGRLEFQPVMKVAEFELDKQYGKLIRKRVYTEVANC